MDVWRSGDRGGTPRARRGAVRGTCQASRIRPRARIRADASHHIRHFPRGIEPHCSRAARNTGEAGAHPGFVAGGIAGRTQMILSKEQKREVARRIENWALWYWRGSVGPRAPGPSPAYNLVNALSPRDQENNNLVISGEAEDTDRILRRMEPKITEALTVHHTAPSTWTPSARAKRCRCHVATYYRRVERAEWIFHRQWYSARRVTPALAA